MTILTRVDPSNPSTSILLRARTGWEQLLQKLNGHEDYCKNGTLKKRCVGTCMQAAGCGSYSRRVAESDTAATMVS